MTTHWRFRHEGRTLGPYPLRLLEQLRARGSLPESAQVQCVEDGRWMPLCEAIGDAPTMLPAMAEPAAAMMDDHSLFGALFVRGEDPRAQRAQLIAVAVYGLPLLLLLLTFYWALHSVRDDIDPRPWWLGLAALTAAMLLWYAGGGVWLWLIGRHDRAVAAPSRAMMAFAGLLLAGLLADSYRPLKALVNIALNPDPYGQFSIAFEDAGRSVAFSGSFGYAAPARLQAELRKHPGVNTLLLDSPGGWMVAGRGIARVLRQAGVHTVVVRNGCASACILAFESVPLRVLDDGAVLGFHSESSQLDEADSRNVNDSFVAALSARGVPDDFIRQAVSTPPAQLWQPDLPRLFRDKVIDRVRFDGRELDGTSFFLAVVDRYLAGPDFAPLAQGLGEFAPAHLRKLREDVARLLANDSGAEQIGQTTQHTLDTDGRLALERAGDAAQVERAGVLAGMLGEFSVRAPQLCTPIWTGQNTAAVDAALEPAEQRTYLRLMGDMLLSAARDPRPPPSDADGADLMGRAVRKTYNKYGRNAFDVPAALIDGRITESQVCEMGITTFRQIQAMRPSEAGALMRWLAHGNSPGGGEAP